MRTSRKYQNFSFPYSLNKLLPSCILWIMFVFPLNSQASESPRTNSKPTGHAQSCFKVLHAGPTQGSTVTSPSAHAFLRFIQHSLTILLEAQKDIETLLRSPQPRNPFAHRSELAAVHLSQGFNALIKNLSSSDWAYIQKELSLIMNDRNSTKDIKAHSINQTRHTYSPALLVSIDTHNDYIAFEGNYIFLLSKSFESSEIKLVTPIVVDSLSGQIYTYPDYSAFDRADHYQLAETKDGIYVTARGQSVAIPIYAPIAQADEPLMTIDAERTYLFPTLTKPQFTLFGDQLFAVFRRQYGENIPDKTERYAVTEFDTNSREFRRLALPEEFADETEDLLELKLLTNSDNQNLFLIARTKQRILIFSLFKAIRRSDSP